MRRYRYARMHRYRGINPPNAPWRYRRYRERWPRSPHRRRHHLRCRVLSEPSSSCSTAADSLASGVANTTWRRRTARLRSNRPIPLECGDDDDPIFTRLECDGHENSFRCVLESNNSRMRICGADKVEKMRICSQGGGGGRGGVDQSCRMPDGRGEAADSLTDVFQRRGAEAEPDGVLRNDARGVGTVAIGAGDVEHAFGDGLFE